MSTETLPIVGGAICGSAIGYALEHNIINPVSAKIANKTGLDIYVVESAMIISVELVLLASYLALLAGGLLEQPSADKWQIVSLYTGLGVSIGLSGLSRLEANLNS